MKCIEKVVAGNEVLSTSAHSRLWVTDLEVQVPTLGISLVSFYAIRILKFYAFWIPLFFINFNLHSARWWKLRNSSYFTCMQTNALKFELVWRIKYWEMKLTLIILWLSGKFTFLKNKTSSVWNMPSFLVYLVLIFETTHFFIILFIIKSSNVYIL